MKVNIVLVLFLFICIPSFASAQVCVPDCRDGYVCSSGTCISACNPPCEGNTICTAARTCVSPSREPDTNQFKPDNGAPANPYLVQEEGTQSFRGVRLHFGPMLGFGGEATFKNEIAADLDLDLETTRAFLAQFLFSTSNIFVIGAETRFASLTVDGANESFSMFEIGPIAKFKFPNRLDGGTVLEPWVSLSAGLAKLSFPNQDSENGVFIGLHAGLTTWFTNTIGIYASLGYRYTVHKESSFSGDTSFSTAQIQLGTGLSIRFGG